MLPQFESSFLEDISVPLRTVTSSDTFPRTMECFSKAMEKTAREQFLEYIEKMDRDFRSLKGRSENYYVKDTRERTIVTILGEITYKRTVYLDRSTGKSFAYVDEKLGIDRYIRYTDDVGALVYEACADENSMIKVSREIGKLIHSKFSLEKDSEYAIPRQTIYNLLKRAGNIRVLPSETKKKVKDIYLLLDEKFIGSKEKDKDGNRKKIMVRTCLVTEGLDTSCLKRHSYIKPHYISSCENGFAEKVYEHLERIYDTGSIEHFHILSDGGNWIESFSKDLPYSKEKKTKYLDRFHAFQSMWRVSQDEEIYKRLVKELFKGKKTEFTEILTALKDTFPQREKTIEKEKTYLLKNWNHIRNMISLKDMNCAMEQVISHHLASHFSSVPKSYSKENIERYLSERDNYRNGYNLKKLYVQRTGQQTLVNKTVLDHSALPYAYTEIPGKKHSSWEEDNPSLLYGQMI